MATLPVELVQQIISDVVRITLQDEPHLAARLQLVSTATRAFLMPALFHTLVVRLPNPAKTLPTTPSFEFFCQMLVDQEALPRAYIRHLILRGTVLFGTALDSVRLAVARLTEASRRWQLDSVFVDHPQIPRTLEPYIATSALVSMGCTGDVYLRWVFYDAMSPSTPRRTRSRALFTGKMSDQCIGVAVRTYMGSQSGVQALNVGLNEEPCALHILVDWPNPAQTSEADRIADLSTSVARLLWVPQLRIVLDLSRESEFALKMSTKLMVALGEMRNNQQDVDAPGVQEWARLQVQWLVPKPAHDRAFGHWIENMMTIRPIRVGGHVS